MHQNKGGKWKYLVTDLWGRKWNVWNSISRPTERDERRWKFCQWCDQKLKIWIMISTQSRWHLSLQRNHLSRMKCKTLPTTKIFPTFIYCFCMRSQFTLVQRSILHWMAALFSFISNPCFFVFFGLGALSWTMNVFVRELLRCSGRTTHDSPGDSVWSFCSWPNFCHHHISSRRDENVAPSCRGRWMFRDRIQVTHESRKNMASREEYLSGNKQDKNSPFLRVAAATIQWQQLAKIMSEELRMSENMRPFRSWPSVSPFLVSQSSCLSVFCWRTTFPDDENNPILPIL